jgi:endonuclease G
VRAVVIVSVIFAARASAAAPAPIIGGHDATAGAWPDAVAVFAGGTMTCAGVLVAPDVVVTAGHCCGTAGSSLDPPPDHVLVGALRLSAPQDGETIAVTQAIAHPDHVNDLDVGVLLLATPSTRPPRALATGAAADAIADGAPAIIAGWGLTSPTGTTGADVLKEASVTIVEASCTSANDGCRPALMPGGELRAGGGGTDTCSGDSGGPLYVAWNGATYLAATTYGGYTSAGAMCGDGGIYERADRSIDWIEQASGRTLPRVPTADGSCSAGASRGAWLPIAMIALGLRRRPRSR